MYVPSPGEPGKASSWPLAMLHVAEHTDHRSTPDSASEVGIFVASISYAHLVAAYCCYTAVRCG
jgi:hypothetical protein